MGIGNLVLRGALCGLLAGVVAGTFAFVFAEPLIDRAVALESQRAAAATVQGVAPAPAVEVFSRPTQHAGLIVATAVLGTAFGALFGMLFFALWRGRNGASRWRLALTLGAGLFVGYFLVPFVRYPANPPGAGSPDTIGLRSSATLLAAVVGLLAVATAWRLAAWLRERRTFEPLRHLAGLLVFLVVVALGYAILPGNPDPVSVPASMLWDFRLLSVATQLLLWATLAIGFGFWVEWSSRRR